MNSIRPVTASLDDPFYYLENFRFVLAWVAERYGDLLSGEEHAFLADFTVLPRPAQGLLVRMTMRKGSLFRTGKLCYAEIGDIDRALEPLVGRGWVDDDPTLDAETLFMLLTKAELLQALAHDIAAAGLSAKATKAVLREALVPHLPDAQPLSAWWPSAPDRVVALTAMDVCERLRLMFFGNLRQGWEEFVLTELGLQRFESVELTRQSRAFQHREEVDAYLHLHRLRERFEAGEASRQLWREVPEERHANPWLASRRDKLLQQLARDAERRGDTDMALAIYTDGGHPEARVRHLRVLERLGQYDIALQLTEQALAVPGNEAEAQHLERLRPRLRRRLGLPPLENRSGLAMERGAPTSIERLDLCLPRAHAAFGVEAAVCVHLGREDAPLRYVENTLFAGLFGLLCWRALFAPLPGAFFHPFHAAPADLLREDFVTRRRELFDACLVGLDDDRYRQTIRRTWRDKYGLASPFVHWPVLDETLLEQALACVPAEHLKRIFERLLRDIAANRAGLPDLIQLWPEQARYRLIEVKGPGDRLQDNQRRWLDFFQRHEVPVAVCHVRWEDTE